MIQEINHNYSEDDITKIVQDAIGQPGINVSAMLHWAVQEESLDVRLSNDTVYQCELEKFDGTYAVGRSSKSMNRAIRLAIVDLKESGNDAGG